jgi:hypothetical protein
MDPKIFGLPSEKPLPPGEFVMQEHRPACIMIGVQEVVGGFKIYANADANHPLLEAVASTPRQAAKHAADLIEQIIKQNQAAAKSGLPAS